MSITFTVARDEAPEVNMNSANAAFVLDFLGYVEDDDPGEASAEDFLGRVLVAQALADVVTDDQGFPAFSDGRWHVGGRRPGYLAEKLAELRDIAEWARRTGTAVVWG